MSDCKGADKAERIVVFNGSLNGFKSSVVIFGNSFASTLALNVATARDLLENF